MRPLFDTGTSPITPNNTPPNGFPLPLVAPTPAVPPTYLGRAVEMLSYFGDTVGQQISAPLRQRIQSSFSALSPLGNLTLRSTSVPPPALQQNSPMSADPLLRDETDSSLTTLSGSVSQIRHAASSNNLQSHLRRDPLSEEALADLNLASSASMPNLSNSTREANHDDRSDEEDVLPRAPSSPPQQTWGSTQKSAQEAAAGAASGALNLAYFGLSAAANGLGYTLVELAKSSGILSEPDWVKKKFELAVATALEGYREDHNLTRQTRFVDSPLKELFANMTPPQGLLGTSGEAKHFAFLTSLRAALLHPHFQSELSKRKQKVAYDPWVDAILQICQSRFEEAHHYRFCEGLVRIILNGSNRNELSEGDFDVIERTPQTLKLPQISVAIKKFMGHVNINFDPHLQGNVPFVLGTVNLKALNAPSEKPVKFLRMGAPTIEYFGQKAEINPEFKGYLQALAFAGKKHLYVSLQNDKQKQIHQGDESARNGAIKSLQNEFPENFFAVVLAQDSHFYKQERGFAKDQQRDEFLKEFFSQMFEEKDTGFYFPDAWKNDDRFKNGVNGLLKQVCDVVFNGKRVLTIEEKKDFIEIFYPILTLYLSRYCEADNVNITCKDAIDRAGKVNSLLLKIIMIAQGNGDSPEHKHIHQVFTHAPAFSVKSQAIIHSRLHRLMSAFERLNDEAIRRNICREAPSWGLDLNGDIDIKKKNDIYQAITKRIAI